MLSCFKKKKRFAKELDRIVLATGSCGPTPILGVHEINKKSGSLCLKKPIFILILDFQSSTSQSNPSLKPCLKVECRLKK